MKEALILHGTNGNSKDNWFPWLKQQLEDLGWKVWTPDLPQADHPNVKRYNQHVFANKEWDFNSNSIIIGHSSGSVAALGLLQKLPSGIVIDTCILIGSFKDNLGWDNLDGLFEEPFDFKQIREHCRKFVFIHSDNDPYCPLEHARYLSEQLDGKLIVIPGEAHFSIETNPKYSEFPYLLNLLRRE
jgi:uncharacterized protein